MKHMRWIQLALLSALTVPTFLEAQTHQLLPNQVVNALVQRIDSGEYGCCLQCEEPIAFARLQAQPFASLCLDCQSASENA